MGLSRYLIREVSKFYFGKRSAWTYPALYVGLFTTLPTGPDDAGTEVSAAGYARQLTAHAGDSATDDWSYALREPVFGHRLEITNTRAFYCGPFGAPVTLTGFGIWDAATAGNLLIYGRLSAAVSAPAGRGVTLPTGSILMTSPTLFDGPLLAHLYAFPNFGFGPLTLYQPAQWWVYALTQMMTFDLWHAAYATAPAGYAVVPNDAATWPVVGSDVTNGAAWSFAPAAADGPDITHLLFVGKYASPAYAPFWCAPLTAAATVRQGERLEIAAGAVAFDEL